MCKETSSSGHQGDTNLQQIDHGNLYEREGSRRNKRDPLTIIVVGELANLMIGKVINTKYANPGSPIVSVHINETYIPKK